MEQAADDVPPRTGYRLALWSWAPIALWAISAASARPTDDTGCMLCINGKQGVLFNDAATLIPFSIATLVLASVARKRARKAIEICPETVTSDTAHSALRIAWLTVAGVTVAWAWLAVQTQIS
jgi:hypothetical protein